MAFTQGLGMKGDKKPDQVFRVLLGGLDALPGKPSSVGVGKLKLPITGCLGHRTMQGDRVAGAGRPDKIERWGAELGTGTHRAFLIWYFRR